MGLPSNKKLEVIDLVIANEYDLTAANELREQFRRERYE